MYSQTLFLSSPTASSKSGIKSLSQTLTNVSKLVLMVVSNNNSVGDLLEGLAFHLESLVLAYLSPMSVLFVKSISIMARLKRLELYDVGLAKLDLSLLRVVLGRLEHLVLGKSFGYLTDEVGQIVGLVSLDTWTTLLGYLKPGQLKHLGLIGYMNDNDHPFPWKELFEELSVGRQLAAGLTSLQLGVISFADLKAIAKIFGGSAQHPSRLSSLNFKTLAEEVSEEEEEDDGKYIY